jgi:hypothetical protein
MHLEWNLEFVEKIGSLLHDWKVTGAAHDN